MKLEHLQIQTKDLNNTEKFYYETLCLPIIKKDLKSISIQVGNSILEFIESNDLESIYHIAFNIPENKLQEAITWSESKIGLIVIDDRNVIATFENWNANAIYFYDNNGNLLEFIARHDLDNAQNEPFDSKSILNISEIGIVNENPFELANQLIDKYELNFFTKNSNSKLFSALGNDEGLLIIVKPGRNWYPIQVPAKNNQTLVYIKNSEKQIKLEF